MACNCRGHDGGPYTRANMDTLLFGNHNGLKLGREQYQPYPTSTSVVPMSFMMRKSNPYFMAPGWRVSERNIDVRAYRLAGHYGPKIYTSNPYDYRYGTINNFSSKYLSVIRANQMGRQSFV